MLEKYVVTIDRPKDISVTEVKDYMKKSIQGWRHGGNPESVFYDADLKLKIERIKNA